MDVPPLDRRAPRSRPVAAAMQPTVKPKWRATTRTKDGGGPRPEELTNGLWRWTARHPEWHPSGFDDEVASFALDTDDGILAADESL